MTMENRGPFKVPDPAGRVAKLFDYASEEQMQAWEAIYKAALAGFREAERIRKDADLNEDAKRRLLGEALQKLEESTTAARDAALAAQDRLEKEARDVWTVEAPPDVRTYYAARAAQALANVRTLDDLEALYESETVRQDPVLRDELERAVELHPLGREEGWKTLKANQEPRQLRELRNWRSRLQAYLGTAVAEAREALGTPANRSEPKPPEPAAEVRAAIQRDVASTKATLEAMAAEA